MPATKELRHPDFLGLRLDRDPVHPAAVIAANAQARKPGLLEKRPGFRRMNQRHYTGAVLLLDDIQRICDYGKFLVVAGHYDLPPFPTFPGPDIYQHDPINDPGDPVFDPAWAPVVAASANPLIGFVPLLVAFSSVGSFDPMGGPLAYSWDFDDGSPLSNQANPGHLYAVTGAFNAVLTVTNQAGKTASAGVNVLVQPVPIPAGVWDTVGAGTWLVGP
jgi:hypothetical protein